MPRITVYADGALIADSGATTATPIPVTPPAPAPTPVTPPPVNPGNGSTAAAPKTLTAAGLMKERLNSGESRYYVFTVDPAKNFHIDMNSVDQSADCNMLMMEGTNAGIDAKYAEVVALYEKYNGWNSFYQGAVVPRAWAVMSHASAGESITPPKPYQSPTMFLRITNTDPAKTAMFNLGYTQY